MKTPADSPRVAMLAALGRCQNARQAMGEHRYREAGSRVRSAEKILKRALEDYHHERAAELREIDP